MKYDTVNSHDLSYAAGMLDGDGCISVNKGRQQKNGAHSYMITVRVSQKLEEIPLWFLSVFGGRVRTMGKGKWAVSNGRPVFFSPMIAWELYCRDAAEFLTAIIPYLKMKKTRAELAVRLANMQRLRGGRGYRYGGKPVTLEESSEREKLAVLIREENQKGNTRVAMTSKWGVN
jgi:hypothetical protein